MNKLIVTNNQITKYNEQKEEFYALFEVNNRQFALKSQNVLEIIKLIELEYPNKMPSCFLGLMEYSENPVGVLDLRDILKMPRVKYDINSKIIVLVLQCDYKTGHTFPASSFRQNPFRLPLGT